MSTRCQVYFEHNGEFNIKQTALLYHHCDGYPEYMIPIMARGLLPSGGDNDWQLERAGKALVYLLAADSTGYEIEALDGPGPKQKGFDVLLHADIYFFYHVKMSLGKTHVYIFEANFKDKISWEALKPIEDGPLETLFKKYPDKWRK